MGILLIAGTDSPVRTYLMRRAGRWRELKRPNSHSKVARFLGRVRAAVVRQVLDGVRRPHGAKSACRLALNRKNAPGWF